MCAAWACRRIGRGRWLAAVIERGGREALQLSDKPALEQAFADYADREVTVRRDAKSQGKSAAAFSSAPLLLDH